MPIDAKAIAKARRSLRVLEKTLPELLECKTYDEFTGLWYIFIVAAKNVYTALEQGSKTSAQNRQWYGEKKRVRRNDPLLQYIVQARDDDEHGMEFGSKIQPGQYEIGVYKEGYSQSFYLRRVEMKPNGDLFVEAESNDGKPVLIRIIPGHIKLMPVTGRGHVTYQPPTEHLGKPLSSEDQSPYRVAEMARNYLEALVKAAELLA